MNLSRLAVVAVAGCCLLRLPPLAAQEVAPVEMEKHYSADLTITTKDGMAIQSKTYMDGDKMRSDASMNGIDMEFIVRKDQQKIYQILVADKMITEMPYDADKFAGSTAASFGPEGKFELIGPETAEGVACTKYKVTSDKTKQVFFFWLDAARKVPVEMAAVDGSLTVKWKNFAVGPQDAALFEPPTGYQTMSSPAIPGMPGQ